MNAPEILMDLETSLHRIQQRLYRIKRLLGELPNGPRAERKGAGKRSRDEDLLRQEPPAGETQDSVPEALG